MRKVVFLWGCVLVFVTTMSPIAYPHDLKGLAVERSSLDPEVRAKFDQIRELRRLLSMRSATNQDQALEAVVQKTLRWPGDLARVCFFDGAMEAREHVAQVAIRWTASTSLKLDFGPPNNRRSCDPKNLSDIRVSFRGSGYWSYVGTQAKDINPYKQTLNLEGIDKASFDLDNDGTILHEFGHAIGFEHEHQSPVGGCDEQFNWSYLYTSLGWSKEEVDRNMRALSVSSSMDGLLVTPFDGKSIMLYSLAAAAFKDPEHASCYIAERNNEISTVDHKAAATVYPALAQPPAPAASASAPTSYDGVVAAQQLNRLQELVPH
jgi:hypothetical protein